MSSGCLEAQRYLQKKSKSKYMLSTELMIQQWNWQHPNQELCNISALWVQGCLQAERRAVYWIHQTIYTSLVKLHTTDMWTRYTLWAGRVGYPLPPSLLSVRYEKFNNLNSSIRIWDLESWVKGSLLLCCPLSNFEARMECLGWGPCEPPTTLQIAGVFNSGDTPPLTFRTLICVT